MLNDHVRHEILNRKWIYGMKSPLWIKEIEFIRDFKIKHEDMLIQVAPFEHVFNARMENSKKKSLSKEIIAFQDWPCGGIRIAHIHLDNEVFILEDKLWNEFSTKLRHNMVERLSSARAINFEQLTELSDAIYPLL